MLFLLNILLQITLISFCKGLLSTKINFGSCIVPGFNQPLWKDISNRNPDLFIFTGDATYLDYENSIFHHQFAVWKELLVYPLIEPFINKSLITDPSKYKSTWNWTYFNLPYYDKLLSNNHTSIIGIYDDHDFGYDDADGSNPHKKLTRQLFIDFLNLTDKISNIPNEGLYYHYPLEITIDNSVIQTIDIIVLDIHYFAGIERKDDILGNKQWNWFEDIMNIEKYINGTSKLKGDFILIISGEQILAFNRYSAENQWRYSSYSRNRLFKNIIIPWMSNIKTKNKLLFITGDIHYAEMNKLHCINRQNNNNIDDYFVINEITSSSMTTSFLSNRGNTALLTRLFYNGLLWYENDLITECRYGEINFGEIEFEWKLDINNNEYIIDNIWMRIIGENEEIGCEKNLKWLNVFDYNYDKKYLIDKEYLYHVNGTDYNCYSVKIALNYDRFGLMIRDILCYIHIRMLIYFPLIVLSFLGFIFYQCSKRAKIKTQ